MEYAATFTQTIQTSEDSWDAVTRAIHLTGDVTIFQLEQEYRAAIGNKNAEICVRIMPMIKVGHIKEATK